MKNLNKELDVIDCRTKVLLFFILRVLKLVFSQQRFEDRNERPVQETAHRTIMSINWPRVERVCLLAAKILISASSSLQWWLWLMSRLMMRLFIILSRSGYLSIECFAKLSLNSWQVSGSCIGVKDSRDARLAWEDRLLSSPSITHSLLAFPAVESKVRSTRVLFSIMEVLLHYCSTSRLELLEQQKTWQPDSQTWRYCSCYWSGLSSRSSEMKPQEEAVCVEESFQLPWLVSQDSWFSASLPAKTVAAKFEANWSTWPWSPSTCSWVWWHSFNWHLKQWRMSNKTATKLQQNSRQGFERQWLRERLFRDWETLLTEDCRHFRSQDKSISYTLINDRHILTWCLDKVIYSSSMIE